MTGYLWEPIGLLVDPIDDVRKLRNYPFIRCFEGDSSLDDLKKELLERNIVFWTPFMTDYVWEPIGLLVDPIEDGNKLRTTQKMS